MLKKLVSNKFSPFVSHLYYHRLIGELLQIRPVPGENVWRNLNGKCMEKSEWKMY